MTDSKREALELGIGELGDAFRRKHYSPVEAARACLDRISQTEPHVHAWVVVDEARALNAAALAEREIMAGCDRGPLHGVPIGIKDIFDVAGFPTRCGSAAMRDAPVAPKNAATVDKLEAGGAVVMGKTVTQEFAAGTISPPARNPWDPTRIPGGSSGGSAAAVAVRGCFGAMGSDTGGSIRIPAAACGVSGFKPAYGALDMTGIYPLSWSLDTAGPIARTVDDTWHMWQALSVSDDRAIGVEVSGPPPRIGVSRQFFWESLQSGVANVIDDAVSRLAASGMTIVETPWADAAAARACSFLINRVETSVVHEAVAINEPERFARYAAELRLRVAAGRTMPAVVYARALQARQVVRSSIASLFAEHGIDALLAPTLPTTAIPADRLVIEGTGVDESVGASWTRLTMPFNATGQPVICLPCGLDSSGLPVGLQLAGRPNDERRLFAVARAVEIVLEFHNVRPPTSWRVPPTALAEEAT